MQNNIKLSSNGVSKSIDGRRNNGEYDWDSFISLLNDKGMEMEEHDAADEDAPSFQKGVRLVAVAEVVSSSSPTRS